MCQCLFILPLFTSTNISVWTNFIQHSHIFIYKLLVFHYGVISVRKKTKQNKNIDLNWSELILRFYSGQKGIRYLKRNCVNMGILCNLPPPLAVSECDTIVVITNPKSVTTSQMLTTNKSHYIITVLFVENLLHSAETCDAGQSGWDTDTLLPVTTHCTLNRIFNMLFWGKKLHYVAVHLLNHGNRHISRWLCCQHSDIASPSCYQWLELTLRRSLTSIIQSGVDFGALCCLLTWHNTVTHCTW